MRYNECSMNFTQKIVDRRWIQIIVVALIFFIIGSASYLVINKKSSPVETPIAQPAPSVVPFEVPEELKNVDSFNVLLLGYGGAGHDGGYLTDVVMLVHFDFKKKIIGMISIPRDLWVTLPSGKQSKINAAFINEDAPQYPTQAVTLDEALQGATKTKSVIENATGLTPHFFIGIDFNSFSTLIDKLGGVDVQVPESFTDQWYPVKGRELELCDHTPAEVTKLSNTLSGFELEKQFPCRYETLRFTKGQTHMDGEMALKFVRSRHSSSDFARSQRQQAVLLGLREKLTTGALLKDPVGLFTQFQKLIQTNLTENLIKNIVPLVANIGQYQTKQIGLSTDNVLVDSRSSQGAAILIPRGNDWTAVKNYIIQELQ